MRDAVFTRSSGWIPNVIREDGELKLMLAAGADANHEPRTFTFPIGEAHLAVIREDLARHLLLWSAVLPLCDAAGTRGRLDENAAVALLDPVLLSAPADVDALFRRIRWDRSRLVAHGADIALLERGQVCEAMRAATERSNEKRAQEYHADRRRAERGAVLGPLDAAILRYTGQYLHGATIPRRIPDAVDPALLPQVMRVIATAEQACAGMRIGLDPRRGKRATDKGDWDRMAKTVDAAVRRAHPELVSRLASLSPRASPRIPDRAQGDGCRPRGRRAGSCPTGCVGRARRRPRARRAGPGPGARRQRPRRAGHGFRRRRTAEGPHSTAAGVWPGPPGSPQDGLR